MEIRPWLPSVSPRRCARDESQKTPSTWAKDGLVSILRERWAFRCVLINDAALQALGSYRGGRMLFLGLGTGLGSALVWDKTLMPLELGDLPYRTRTHHRKLPRHSRPGAVGRKKWKREVAYAVTQLRKSFVADYVVLGGGLVHRFGRLAGRN